MAEMPFNVASKSMATVDETAQGPLLSVKGAPETVLARCVPGADVELLRSAVAALAERGHRVLALADAATTDLLSGSLRPLGIAAFADTVRASAAPEVAALHGAGIRMVVVTDDHAATANSIARDGGICGSIVDGRELQHLETSSEGTAWPNATVLARVEPAIKAALVDAHARGEIVAMTGDETRPPSVGRMSASQ